MCIHYTTTVVYSIHPLHLNRIGLVFRIACAVWQQWFCCLFFSDEFGLKLIADLEAKGL